MSRTDKLVPPWPDPPPRRPDADPNELAPCPPFVDPDPTGERRFDTDPNELAPCPSIVDTDAGSADTSPVAAYVEQQILRPWPAQPRLCPPRIPHPGADKPWLPERVGRPKDPL